MAPKLPKELTSPTLLCRPDGSLDPAAVGWARHPLVRANLSGHWPRKKRWSYWCVATPECVLTMTLFDLDYLGAAALYFLDRVTGEKLELAIPTPLGAGVHFGETSLDDATLDTPFLSLAFTRDAQGTRLRARSRRLRADVRVTRPPAHETLDVVVPFAGGRFQHTSKHFALPATGHITVDKRHRHLDGHACLDFGRGVWPYKSAWNWASAAGEVDGVSVGLNLGGQWTRGSGVTENAILVGGKLTKLDDEITFTQGPRWTLRSSEVDVRVTPEHVWPMRVELGLAGAQDRLVWGRFDGTVAGQRVDGLFGSAEDFAARW